MLSSITITGWNDLSWRRSLLRRHDDMCDNPVGLFLLNFSDAISAFRSNVAKLSPLTSLTLEIDPGKLKDEIWRRKEPKEDIRLAKLILDLLLALALDLWWITSWESWCIIVILGWRGADSEILVVVFWCVFFRLETRLCALPLALWYYQPLQKDLKKY